MHSALQSLGMFWIGGFVILVLLFFWAQAHYRNVQKSIPPSLRGLTIGHLGDPLVGGGWNYVGLLFGLLWLATPFLFGWLSSYIPSFLFTQWYHPIFPNDAVVLPDESQLVWVGIWFGAIVGGMLSFAIVWGIGRWMIFLRYRQMLKKGPLPPSAFMQPQSFESDDNEESYLSKEDIASMQAEAARARAAIQSVPTLEILWRQWRAGYLAMIFFLLAFMWFGIGGWALALADTYQVVTKDGFRENRFWSIQETVVPWEDVQEVTIALDRWINAPALIERLRGKVEPWYITIAPRSGRAMTMNFVTRKGRLTSEFANAVLRIAAQDAPMTLNISRRFADSQTTPMTPAMRAQLRAIAGQPDAHARVFELFSSL